jgi:hypothetical protein
MGVGQKTILIDWLGALGTSFHARKCYPAYMTPILTCFKNTRIENLDFIARRG